MSEFNNFIPTGNSREDTMRLFIGNNADYYLKYYKKLKETSKKISWNWSASLLSPYWFFARKMYLLGSIVTFIIVMFSQGAAMLVNYIDNPKIYALSMPWSIACIAFWIFIGAFANYFYISHMESKVIFPGEDGINKEDAKKLNMLRGGLSLNGIINGMILSYLIGFLVENLVAML